MQRGSKNFTKSEEKLREELKKVLEECERKEQTINRFKICLVKFLCLIVVDSNQRFLNYFLQ